MPDFFESFPQYFIHYLIDHESVYSLEPVISLVNIKFHENKNSVSQFSKCRRIQTLVESIVFIWCYSSRDNTVS